METAARLPQITTVIPTYNRPQLLRRALRSVLNQTFRDFRVCIYGDSSSEETAAAVAEEAKGDPRVGYHRHAERIGVARNYLYGMEQVETPFFSFLGDDDVLLPNFYQDALEGFQRFPEAAFSGLGVVAMYVEEGLGALLPPTWPEGICRPPDGLRNMLTTYPPLWTAILFRKELIDEVGLLDHEVGNGCDIDYEMRVVAHHPIVFSRRPGALGLVHSGALTVQTRLDDIWPGNMKMIRNTIDDSRLDPELRKLASRVLVSGIKRRLFFGWGLRAIMEDRGDEARRSAEILSREFGEMGRARVLRFVDGIHRIFPPLRRASAMVLRMRRRWQKSRWKPAIRRQGECFRTYAGFLNSDWTPGGDRQA